MRPIVADAAWSVCVSVCWSQPWALQKWMNQITDRDSVFTVDLGPKEPWIRWRSISPTGRGTFEGVPSVDILNVIYKGQHMAMRPLATIDVATCYYFVQWGVKSIAISVFVCPYMHVSPLAYLRNHMSKLHKILCTEYTLGLLVWSISDGNTITYVLSVLRIKLRIFLHNGA